MQLPQWMPRKLSDVDWIKTIILICAIIAAVSAVVNWYRPAKMLTTQQFIPVPQIKEITKVQRVTIPGPEKIVVIQKDEAAEELDLPADVVNDPAKQLTATADIPPSEGGSQCVAVINTTTGESSMIAKEKPLPLFGLPSKWEVGARYGWDTSSNNPNKLAGDIHARWQFLRVGPVKAGVYSELNTEPGAKAMIELAW